MGEAKSRSAQQLEISKATGDKTAGEKLVQSGEALILRSIEITCIFWKHTLSFFGSKRYIKV